MASVVASLFGPTPEQLASQRAEQDAVLAQNAARVSPYYGAGYGIGMALGRGAEALFGSTDPALQKATLVQRTLTDINKNLTAEEIANPALTYNKIATTFAQVPGLEQESIMAAEKAREFGLEDDVKRATISKLKREANPNIDAWKTLAGKSTPASVKDSIASNYDIGLLQLTDGGLSPGDAFVKSMNVLVDPTASAEDKKKAFSSYQFLFPVVSGGAFGQYVPQISETGISFQPAPGSPEAEKVATAKSKEQKRLVSAFDKSEIISASIDKALPLITEKTTGAVGGITRAIPFTEGTDAGSLAGYIDTIKSNIGFDQLQKMRTESPTGGALGQVAVKELDYLQAALGNLNPNLDSKVLKENLKAVQTHYKNFMNELEKEMQAAKGKGVGQSASAPATSSTTPPGRSSTGALKVKQVGDVSYEEFAPGRWRVVQ